MIQAPVGRAHLSLPRRNGMGGEGAAAAEEVEDEEGGGKVKRERASKGRMEPGWEGEGAGARKRRVVGGGIGGNRVCRERRGCCKGGKLRAPTAGKGTIRAPRVASTEI